MRTIRVQMPSGVAIISAERAFPMLDDEIGRLLTDCTDNRSQLESRTPSTSQPTAAVQEDQHSFQSYIARPPDVRPRAKLAGDETIKAMKTTSSSVETSDLSGESMSELEAAASSTPVASAGQVSHRRTVRR